MLTKDMGNLVPDDESELGIVGLVTLKKC